MSMVRCTLVLIAGTAVLVAPAFPCSCGPAVSGPACSLVGSRDVIFTGRVAFSNDDGSGRFAQGTLVQFTVDEVFKGLPADTTEVWIDPGSYTSCYAEYKVGQRYLMFASDPAKGRGASFLAMTVKKYPGQEEKPVPPGFDLHNPPRIYLSAECHGSRGADYAESDLQWLREWKAGKTTTRIYGKVLENYNMYFLPPRDEPPLAGVTIKVQGSDKAYTAVSNSVGEYEIKGIPPGAYSLSASLEHYQLQRDNIPIQLAPGACAYVNPGLFTNGRIRGTAVGPDGKPLAGLSLQIARVLPNGRLHDEFGHRITTSSRGEFDITALSSGNFLLGVNLRDAPTVEVPYPMTYFPGTPDRAKAQLVHLDPAEQKDELIFRLPASLQQRNVHVAVRWPDGSPHPDIRVAAFLEIGGEAAGYIDIGSAGEFTAPCLKGLDYRISARAFLDDDPQHRNRPIVDGEMHLDAGDQPARLTIVLDKPGMLP